MRIADFVNNLRGVKGSDYADKLSLVVASAILFKTAVVGAGGCARALRSARSLELIKGLTCHLSLDPDDIRAALDLLIKDEIDVLDEIMRGGE